MEKNNREKNKPAKELSYWPEWQAKNAIKFIILYICYSILA